MRTARGLLCILVCLLFVSSASAEHQKRELKNAAVKLYVSFDNNTRPDFAVGNDPQAGFDNKGNIITGASRNGCAAPLLRYRAGQIVDSRRGTISFHAKIADEQSDFLTLRGRDGESVILKVSHQGLGLVRPWVYNSDGKAIGWDFSPPRGTDLTRWHHMAIVWDQDFGSQFYFDGKLVTQDWPGDKWTNSTPVGELIINAPIGVDELYVFGRALTAEQMAGLAKGQLPGPTSAIPVQQASPRSQFPGVTLPEPPTVSQLPVVLPKDAPQWVQLLHQLPTPKQVQPIAPGFRIHVMNHAYAVSDCIKAAKDFTTADLQQLKQAAATDPSDFGQMMTRVAAWAWYTQQQALIDRITFTATSIDTPGTKHTASLLQNEPVTADMFSPFGKRVETLVNTWLTSGDDDDLARLLQLAVDHQKHNSDAARAIATFIRTRGLPTDVKNARMNTAPVTWQPTNGHVFTRVNQSDATGLHATIYNSASKPQVITMHPWHLPRGSCQLALGPDNDGDDFVDELTRLETISELQRGQAVELTIPPGQSIVQLMQLMKSPITPDRMLDVAVDSNAMRYDAKKDELHINFTNFGAYDAGNVKCITYIDGRRYDEGNAFMIERAKPTQIVVFGSTIKEVSAIRGTVFEVRVEVNGTEWTTANNRAVWVKPE